MRADYADFADNARRAVADIRFAGHIVKMNPSAIVALDNAFCADNLTVGHFIAERV